MKRYFIYVFCSLAVIFILNSCAKHEAVVEPGSDTILEPSPNVNVIFPQEGENLLPGKTYTIQWTAPQAVNKVSITLYRKGVLQKEIKISLENSNKFEWTIPNDIFQSAHYKIKISDLSHPDWNFGWSGNFYVKPEWIAD